MKLSTVFAALVVALLLVSAVYAQQQERRRPVPALTNDDITSAPSRPLREEKVNRTISAGPLRDARTVLESALTTMGEVSSVRTRMLTNLPSGPRDVVIESIKPDRVHVISAEGEMIVIGSKFYLKRGGAWEVTSMPAGAAQSEAGFDFRAFVKQMIVKSSVRITGQVLGDQVIDGVDTIAYEFTVTDRAESGKIQMSVGKEDGYIRRMSLVGGPVDIKIWFTNMNEPFSIEPPM
jgi:outer membrane lipoprotein-sorting protein